MATATPADPDFAPSATRGGDGKKPGHRIQCVVVTPERVLFDELVDFVALPLFDGELGILAGRSPLIGRLGHGELRTTSGGSTQRYFVDGGFAEVRDDVVNVLTGRAIPASAIDTASANAELERARGRKASSEPEVADRNRALDRARAQLRIASHQGKD